MSYRINSDNFYAEGTQISAKVNPSLKLKIMNYRKRIYYCAGIGENNSRTTSENWYHQEIKTTSLR